MTIEMTPVTSSHTTAIGKEDDGWLHFKFKSGQTWRYKNAAHHYDELLKPGVSVGGYFHKHIRNNPDHPGERVD